MNNLTPQQNTFAQQVASGKTYTESYRIAYPKSVKWKDETVWEASSRLMANSNVLARVTELREKTAKRNEVTLDEVLAEMALWLKFNIKSAFNEDGSMKSLHDMTNEETSSIASFECVELFDGSGDKKVHIGYLKKVRLIDKRAVAEMWLKKYGAFITKVTFDEDSLDHIRDLLTGIKE